jgi:hypothetical protein
MAKPKLLDQVRAVMRLQHLSLATEQTYVQWSKPQVEECLTIFVVDGSSGERLPATPSTLDRKLPKLQKRSWPVLSQYLPGYCPYCRVWLGTGDEQPASICNHSRR